MIDWKKQKAGWVQEKAKDLEYLESIDYARLNKLVDAAAASGSARKIVEAHWELKKYESAVLKDRSSQIPLAQADEKIESLVIKYNAIAEKDLHNIKTNEKAKKNKFHSNYNSKTPNIEELMSISKDYSFYKQVLKEPDATIMKYYDFSLNIRTIENEIKNIVSDYQNIQNNSELAGIKSRIEKYKDAIQKSRKKAPRKLLKGIHKAYNYENKDLEKLAKEIPRFEKEDFAKKRYILKNMKNIASDFYELFNKTDADSAVQILKEYLNANLSFDLSGLTNTVYFDNLPKEYLKAIRQAKKSAKEKADCLDEELEKQIKVDVTLSILNNAEIDSLQDISKRIKEDYSEPIEIIQKLIGTSRLQNQLDNTIKQITKKINGINMQTKTNKIIAEHKKTVERYKQEINKEKELRIKKEKEIEKRINEIEKENKNLNLILEKEKKQKEKLQLKLIAQESVKRTVQEFRKETQIKPQKLPKMPVIILDDWISTKSN